MDRGVVKFSSDPFDSLFFNNVGEGLLVEILARLPSRAVIQLKLVCKSWCSLISSQYFITFFNHRRHDPSLPPIDLHLSPSSSGYFIFESAFDRCLSMVRGGSFYRPDLSFLPCPQNSTIRLLGSCADLILCTTLCLTLTLTSTGPMSQTTFYYVCNPLTKQWAALPLAPQFQVKFRSNNVEIIATGFLCVPAPCSICTQCVDNSRCNFVVVKICAFPPISNRSDVSKFEVKLFLSEEGQWKTVVVSSPRTVRFRVLSTRSLVAYKGMLHWLISGFVLVYDPYNCPERFCRVIDMPADIDMPAEEYRPTNIIAGEEEQRSQTIGLFHDRFRVTHVWAIWVEDPVYYIWEMEDYNMGKWSLVHKIRPRASPCLQAFLGDHGHPTHLDPIVNLDSKIRETGFSYRDESTFYWTNSSGWWVADGIVYWITHQCWPTPVPPLTSCLHNSK